MTTLNLLKPGQRAKVLSLQQTQEMKVRLLDMGITPGCIVTLIRKAPFGDPVQILVRGYQLSLRVADAKKIIVKILR